MKILNIKGICISLGNCIDAFYVKIGSVKTCEPCNYSCKTCVGDSELQCLECLDFSKIKKLTS
jgi:hypothetical protein